MLYKITGEKIFKEYSEKWSQNNKMPTVINMREPDTCESPPWYIYLSLLVCDFLLLVFIRRRTQLLDARRSLSGNAGRVIVLKLG
jgi:hypothetical protein